MKIKFIAQHNQIVPWYYGKAYRDYALDVIVAYVIPINWIVNWARSIWWFLREGPKERDIQPLIDSTWNRAYDMGYKHGKLDKEIT